MDVKFTKTSSDKLDQLPVEDGQVVALTDKDGLYYDFENKRHSAADVVSTTKNGLVPKLAGGTAKYLRADGNWATPPDTNTTYSDFVKSGSGAKAGLVPAPSTTAGTTKYLREDGTWQVPPDTKVSYSTAAPSANGTASAGSASTVSRGDHVHPAQTTVSGNAGSATKLATAKTIDGVSFDGSAAISHYGECSTAAATAAKFVALTGFSLVTGARIAIKFTITNTAASPTLNVNSTGGKAIMYRGSAIPANYLAANRVYEFVYDGTDWELVGDVNTNTTYSNMTGATADTAGKAGLVPAPAAGKQTSFLRGDGTWADPPNNNTPYTHPSYTARTGKPTADQTPAFGGTATVSQVTSDSTGHVTNMVDRTIKIPSTLSNGSGTAGLIKTSSTVQNNSGYIASPVISGVPYYQDNTQTIITSGGTGEAYTATVPGITSLTVGVSFLMRAHAQQEVTPPPNGIGYGSVSVKNPTLNVNNLGAREIRISAKSNLSTAYGSPDNAFIHSGDILLMVYENGYWNASVFNLAYTTRPGFVRTWDWDGLQDASDVSESWIVPTEASFIRNISKLTEEKEEIEHGSNENGEYYKFWNGTLICTKTIEQDSFNFSFSSDTGVRSTGVIDLGNWSYTFYTTPVVTTGFIFKQEGMPRVMCGGISHPALSTAGTTFIGRTRLHTLESSDISNSAIYVIGIGRWK